MRRYTAARSLSEQALREREERLTEVYLAGRMTKADYDRRWREVQQQRTSLAVAPAPLLTQQQGVLRTLVDAWDTMTADARKRMLAAIFDSVAASPDGGQPARTTRGSHVAVTLARRPSPILGLVKG